MKSGLNELNISIVKNFMIMPLIALQGDLV
jgi:hypothetical protein